MGARKRSAIAIARELRGACVESIGLLGNSCYFPPFTKLHSQLPEMGVFLPIGQGNLSYKPINMLIALKPD